MRVWLLVHEQYNVQTSRPAAALNFAFGSAQPHMETAQPHIPLLYQVLVPSALQQGYWLSLVSATHLLHRLLAMYRYRISILYPARQFRALRPLQLPSNCPVAAASHRCYSAMPSAASARSRPLPFQLQLSFGYFAGSSCDLPRYKYMHVDSYNITCTHPLTSTIRLLKRLASSSLCLQNDGTMTRTSRYKYKHKHL